MAATAPTRDALHRLVDELPEKALRRLGELFEDAEDAEDAREALADPERFPYETVRRELGLA